jgi:hypothetical protein
LPMRSERRRRITSCEGGLQQALTPKSGGASLEMAGC